MTPKQMNLSDFQRLIDAWGADPARWPADRRAAALSFVASAAGAAEAMAEALALDRLLANAPTHAASAALRARVTRSASLDAKPLRRWLAGLGAGMALAAASAAGVVTGVAAATRQVEPARIIQASDPADDAMRALAEPPDPSAG